MKAFRALRLLSSSTPHKPTLLFPRFYSLQSDPLDDCSSVFDSTDYTLPPSLDSNSPIESHTWDKSYRKRADHILHNNNTNEDEEEEKKANAATLAKLLLQVKLGPTDEAEEADMIVKEEDQKSLSVGIVGAPNAGKSSLTNLMVGTKVAAVSRKTNTTTHEVIGVMTKETTQICFFDTPGLMLRSSGHPRKTDVNNRVESAWGSVELYDVLIVLFDVYRHLTKPDKRVSTFIQRLGAQEHPKQKRVLCMNKIDMVEEKKDLSKVEKQFAELPGYERCFMVSALKGRGVENLTKYLMEQAVKRPWDDPIPSMTEDNMKSISLEVVRERLLHHIHQEIPYVLDHRLIDWKELRDGSIRIEQHFITPKQSQRKILVGKNGSKIGRIGLEANEELRSIFKRDVHLMLQVRVA